MALANRASTGVRHDRDNDGAGGVEIVFRRGLLRSADGRALPQRTGRSGHWALRWRSVTSAPAPEVQRLVDEILDQDRADQGLGRADRPGADAAVPPPGC